MKRAVASRKSRTKGRSIKSTSKRQSAKILKLKIPKKRKISIKRTLWAGSFIALVLWSVYPLKQRAQQRRETRLLLAKIAALKTQNRSLEDEIRRLKSDEYIEQLARRDFGLVKPGESSVLVVPPKDGQSQDTKEQPQNKKEQPKKENSENKENPENKKETKPGKTTSKLANKKEDNSNQSWWQKALNFLDTLTGQKK